MTSVPESQPPTAADLRRLRERIPEHEFESGMDALARLLWVGAQEMAQAEQPAEPEPPAPKTKRRAPRPSPSRLAKWEAAWQAEADAEAES